MSLSPKDMDVIEAKHAAAREIALALGVPPSSRSDASHRGCSASL
jgi:phage portal protein BeeE